MSKHNDSDCHVPFCKECLENIKGVKKIADDILNSTSNEPKIIMSPTYYKAMKPEMDKLFEPVSNEPKKENKVSDFEKQLEHLINKYSQENGSNTPDFILAEYLVNCLRVYNTTITNRDKWYGFKPFDSDITVQVPEAEL